MANLMLIAVEGPHFYAGLEYDVDRDRVTNCAPILRRDFMGKDREHVRRICKRKGWRANIIPTDKQPDLCEE